MHNSSAAPKTLAARIHPFTSNAQREALHVYSNAVQEMQMGNFREALECF